MLTILKLVQNNRVKHNKTIQHSVTKQDKTNAITLQTSSYKLDMKHKITNIYDMDSHALMIMYMAFLYQILSQASFYMYF